MLIISDRVLDIGEFNNQKLNKILSLLLDKPQNSRTNEPNRVIMDQIVRVSKETKQLFFHQGKENQDLKRLLQIEVHQQPIQCLKRQFQSTKNYKDFQTTEQANVRNTDELKKQWAEWSNRLEASIISKNNKIRHHTEVNELIKTTNLSGGSHGAQGFFARKSLQSLKSEKSDEFINIDLKSMGNSQMVLQQNLSLIEDIFLFGPSINDIEKSADRKLVAGHQLYFPETQKPDFQIYGNYLFPKQLEVKHIREKNHNVQLNKIIFKNNKKLDCNIFIFYQDKQSNQKLKKPNKLLQKVNPSNWLYALSIQFSDFVSVVNENITSSVNNKTFTMMNEVTDKSDRFVEGDMLNPREKELGGTTSKKTIAIEEEIFKSNFCLCIMTYFPFIRFLKDILIEVFDSVKLRRMNKYSNCTSFKEIDIYFFIQELKVQLSKFMNEKLKVQAEINKIYEFPINQVQMRLDLSQNNLINEMVADWGFKILKTLDKDSLLDIFCYIMLEESVCFISEDKSVLTFIILLYIVMFSLPFGYPHPCISIVFNDELLDAPFIAVLGINETSKWVEENLQWLTQNKENKLLVNLNEDQVKIKCKKKPRTHKSERLRKIFVSFYKKFETSSMPSIFKKKMQLISRQTSKQQNEYVSQLFNQLHTYYQQELFNHLPNPQIIELIKESCINNSKTQEIESNSNAIYNVLIQKIERYFAQSRKTKNKDSKDPFIDELMKKQLFRLYIDGLYQLK